MKSIEITLDDYNASFYFHGDNEIREKIYLDNEAKKISSLSSIIENSFKYLSNNYRISSPELLINIYIDKKAYVNDSSQDIKIFDNCFDFFEPLNNINADYLPISINIEGRGDEQKTSTIWISLDKRIKEITISNIELYKGSSLDTTYSMLINLNNVKNYHDNLYNSPIKVKTNHLIIENTTFEDIYHEDGNRKDQTLFFQRRNANHENDYKITIKNSKINSKLYKRERKSSDYDLKDISFDNCVFLDEVIFECLCFFNLSFYKCTFEKKFTNRICEFKNLEIIDCYFKDEISIMSSSEIKELLCIYKSTFEKPLFIINTQIYGNLLLKFNTFENIVNISESAFSGFINISTSTYNGDILANSLQFLIPLMQEKKELNPKYETYNYNRYYSYLFKYLEYFNKEIKLSSSYGLDLMSYDTINVYDKFNDLRNSLALIKTSLLKNNNFIDANVFNALELNVRKYQIEQDIEKIWKYHQEEQNDFYYIESMRIDINIRDILDVTYYNYKYDLEIEHYYEITEIILNKKYYAYMCKIYNKFSDITLVDKIILKLLKWKSIYKIKNARLIVDKFLFNLNHIISRNYQKLLEIAFPFYKMPNTIEVGLIKIISVYIIWQIIRSSRNNFR